MFVVAEPDEDVAKTTFTLKEGAEYKIELTFRVKNEIVSGLRYHHAVERKGTKGKSLLHL